MEFGLYLVPVLSGYWFLTHLHYTNYNVVRACVAARGQQVLQSGKVRRAHSGKK